MSGRRPSLPVVTATVALVSLIGLALTARSGPLPFDPPVGLWAADRRAGWVGAVVDAVNVAGSLPVWWSLVLALVAAARTSMGQRVQALAVAGGAEAAATAIKALVGRARPPGADVTDLLVAAGFPSGHVTRTAVFVGLILVLVPWASRHRRLVVGLGLVAVVLMGFARVSAGAHYASDVVGAALLAAVILAAWQLLRGDEPQATQAGA